MQKTSYSKTDLLQTAWQPTTKEHKLSDEVINMVVDAYIKGVEDGFQQAQSAENKMLSKVFQENLEKAMSISANLVAKMKENFALDMQGVYLKIENKISFKTALVLPFDFYVSDKKRDLTDLLITQELEHSTDTFMISFTVLPYKNSLNLQKLFSDGFIFYYVENE